METINKPLRVVHFAQIPCKPFIVNVKNEEEAKLIAEVLAYQHLFLYKENIIPDYSNIILVEMFDEGEWCNYYNEAEGMEWEEFEETYLTEDYTLRFANDVLNNRG